MVEGYKNDPWAERGLIGVKIKGSPFGYDLLGYPGICDIREIDVLFTFMNSYGLHTVE